jgi:hypothetical protein
MKIQSICKSGIVFLAVAVVSIAIGACSQNEPETTKSGWAVFTFSQLAIEGEGIHSDCLKCHSLGWIDSSSRATLAEYQNARLLLSEIAMMPIDSKLNQYQVLSYILLEQGWASEDDVFDVDTLKDIALDNAQ